MGLIEEAVKRLQEAPAPFDSQGPWVFGSPRTELQEFTLGLESDYRWPISRAVITGIKDPPEPEKPDPYTEMFL